MRSRWVTPGEHQLETEHQVVILIHIDSSVTTRYDKAYFCKKILVIKKEKMEKTGRAANKSVQGSLDCCRVYGKRSSVVQKHFNSLKDQFIRLAATLDLIFLSKFASPKHTVWASGRLTLFQSEGKRWHADWHRGLCSTNSQTSNCLASPSPFSSGKSFNILCGLNNFWLRVKTGSRKSSGISEIDKQST